MFYVIMPSFESRQALISHLAGSGILIFIICRCICRQWDCVLADAKALAPSPKTYPIDSCAFRSSPE